MEEPFAMVIAEVPLFDALDPAELALVEQYLLYRKVKMGNTIYTQGEHGNSVCFVVDGELEVIKYDGPERQAHVATLKKGQAVGEMAIIDGMTRSATIRASSDGAVFILKRADFNRIVDEHPVIGIKILKGLARMLSANLRETSNNFGKMMMSI